MASQSGGAPNGFTFVHRCENISDYEQLQRSLILSLNVVRNVSQMSANIGSSVRRHPTSVHNTLAILV